MTAQGCLAYLRFAFGLVLILIGIALLQQSVWFHRHIDAIMRIPFVFGAAGIGVFCLIAGVRMVIARR